MLLPYHQLKYSYACKVLILILCSAFTSTHQANAQSNDLLVEAEQAMLNATKFMVDEVSYNGGYVWNYLPDFSRRWGEFEAFETMIWVQHPGTVSMAHTFLDAYELTGNEYYYKAAEKAVNALIWGQSEYGGWHYMIDFAGDRSLKYWYNLDIGSALWGGQEYHYYYGNDTFDDDVTSDAARVILRIYLENLDPKFKPSLDKAIDFILESQYPLGGWPQRYPLRYDHVKKGIPDYSSYYTFNDDVIWENINFLTQSYLTLGQERFLDPIRRGMQFYLLSLQGNPQRGWGAQHGMDLKPVQARTFEPEALAPSYTVNNAMHLIRFYEWTGDRKFIAPIPDILSWLEDARLPVEQTDNGRYTHPTWVEIGTGKPLYVHRRGSNRLHGEYYIDYSDEKLITHYGQKTNLESRIKTLRDEYQRVNALSPDEATVNSPLKPSRFEGDEPESTPQNYYYLQGTSFDEIPTNSVASETLDDIPTDSEIKEIINALDEQHRWLVMHARTSQPFIGLEDAQEELTDEYCCAHPGDKTDTTAFNDPTDQDYISTREYINNMNLLMKYIGSK